MSQSISILSFLTTPSCNCTTVLSFPFDIFPKLLMYCLSYDFALLFCYIHIMCGLQNHFQFHTACITRTLLYHLCGAWHSSVLTPTPKLHIWSLLFHLSSPTSSAYSMFYLDRLYVACLWDIFQTYVFLSISFSHWLFYFWILAFRKCCHRPKFWLINKFSLEFLKYHSQLFSSLLTHFSQLIIILTPLFW